MGKKGRWAYPRWKTNAYNGSLRQGAECHLGKQDFLDFSNGYRPNRSAKETVADLTFNLQYGCYRHRVEADIKSFFDNLDQDQLLEMLAQPIDDRAFLHLIRQWLKAGILATDGKILDPETGTPQGGVISPILANVYLPYGLDFWFENGVKKHLRGEAMRCRYADDCVPRRRTGGRSPSCSYAA